MARPAGSRVFVTRPARQDIAAVVSWTVANFGEAAARRYEALMLQALDDLGQNPQPLGSRRITGTEGQTFSYRIERSRRNVVGVGAVQRPRHYFVYRLQDDLVEILRLLLDAQDLERQLPRDPPI